MALAFGWFGSWSNQGSSSLYYSLKGIPDSVDIVSIWGPYGSLTDYQKEDLKYVQEVLGTRVVFTVFSHNMANLPGKFENIAENIPAAAQAIADTIHKYGYDGIDFDHECSTKDLFYKEENMTALLKETRQRIGPDKIIMVDGFVDLISKEGWDYANFAVSQAYGASSATRLKQRYDWIKEYIGSNRYIVTENFESYAATEESPSAIRNVERCLHCWEWLTGIRMKDAKAEQELSTWSMSSPQITSICVKLSKS